MEMKEVSMKYRAAILSGAAVVVMIGVPVVYSQQKSNSPATQQSGGGSARAAKLTSTGTHKVEVRDPAYGMTAFTMDVPAGWKFVGTIWRPGGCHPPPTPASGLSYTAQSPDGVTAFVTLPGVSWTWTSNGSNVLGPKCPSTINIDTAAGLLLNIAVPNLHPDAKAVVVVPLPQKLQAAITANNEQNAAKVRGYGLQGTRQFQDAAQVRVEYERNGQQVEESEFAVVDCLQSQVAAMPGGLGQPWHPAYTKRTCSSRGTMITRAPKGHLDEVLAHSTVSSPQINKEWDDRVIHDMTTSFQQMQAASNQEFLAIQAHFKAQTQQMNNQAEQFRAQQQASTDAAMQNDRNTQAGIDHAAHQTVLYSLDRQTFVNPSTGQKIEASSQYNHQWMSSDGSTLIQTQDRTYDPNGQVYPVSQSWTELVPTN